MIITTKKHNQIIDALKEENMQIVELFLKRNTEKLNEEKESHKQIVSKLEKELEEARNLKGIIDKLTEKSIFVDGMFSNHYIDGVLNLGDNVLVYVDDLLGGKVIKQEGVKAIKIDKDGNIKTGLTKSKADKGYSYKLIRE